MSTKYQGSQIFTEVADTQWLCTISFVEEDVAPWKDVTILGDDPKFLMILCQRQVVFINKDRIAVIRCDPPKKKP